MSGAHAKQPKTKILNHAGVCAVPGCDRTYYAKHHCRLHWERLYSNGTTERKRLAPGTPPAERLERMSRREGDCIVYTGHLNKNGYGQITADGVPWTAHRLSYATHNGPLADGDVVRHTCDNPPCISPDHLLAGTHADNGNDKKVRRRSTYGERNAAHRLTESQVLEINQLICQGVRLLDIARQFGVGQSTVSRIKRRKAWSYLFEDAA